MRTQSKTYVVVSTTPDNVTKTFTIEAIDMVDAYIKASSRLGDGAKVVIEAVKKRPENGIDNH